MKRSEHFNVAAGKWLNGYPLSVNGHKYVVICEARRVFVDEQSHHELYVVNKGDEPVSVLANWKIGTYGFAKDKFPFIVPFHKFNPDNIGESLQHNVVKQ